MPASLDLLNNLILFAVKASLFLMAVRWWVSLERGASAATARSVLAASVVAIAAFPFAGALLPQLPIAVIPSALAPLLATSIIVPAGTQWHYNGLLVGVFAVYILVAAALLSHLVAGLLHVRRVTQMAQPVSNAVVNQVRCLADEMGLPRLPRVLTSPAVTTPQVWRAVTPVLLLPRDAQSWPADRLRRVLIHELAHIKRHDWLVQVVLHSLASILWFVPPVWWVLKQTSWYAELACDDWVVHLDGGRADYADDLLVLASGRASAPIGAVALTDKLSCYARISCLLDGSRNHSPFYSDWRTQLLLALVLFLALAPIRLERVTAVELPMRSISALPLHLQALRTAPSTGAPKGFHLNDISWLKSVAMPPDVTQEEIVVQAFRPADAAITTPILVDSTAVVAQPLIQPIPHISMHGPIALFSTTPLYPRKALMQGEQGSVTLVFDIDVNGWPVNIRAVNTDVSETLINAAIDAVRGSRFRPTSIDGVAVITQKVTETFVFTLRSDSTTDNKTR